MICPESRYLLAVDPGPTESGYVRLLRGPDTRSLSFERPAYAGTPWRVQECGVIPSAELLPIVSEEKLVVVEDFVPMGMPVGAASIQTIKLIGRIQAYQDWFGVHVELLARPQVKLHLCGQSRAKDANVNQVLYDRYGGVGGIRQAKGTAKNKGPLFGMKSHAWSALAVGCTWLDINDEGKDAG